MNSVRRSIFCSEAFGFKVKFWGQSVNGSAAFGRASRRRADVIYDQFKFKRLRVAFDFYLFPIKKVLDEISYACASV